MGNTVIRVENLGKQYRLGQIGTGTLSHDLNRFWSRVRGKEDPYLKVGVVNDRAVKEGGDLVWALQHINFEVKQGEVLGIIGKNGAGKSTLLKILSQVTPPTVGQIKIKGRIAALLEVGTGFHTDLTGRENIYLNGAILGMTKAEIKNKFDEIVDFSGVAKYIDTPVKRYSSGMMVRLGFAVAAHLEPEILIVDEVLAVGDAEFQKKCIGKMKDVSGEGRTVLFVSHQMGVINQLCDRAILLKTGMITADGPTKKIVDHYLDLDGNNSEFIYQCPPENLNKEHVFLEVKPVNEKGEFTSNFSFDNAISLQLNFKANPLTPGLRIGVALIDNSQNKVFTVVKEIAEFKNKDGSFNQKVTFQPSLIAPNNYSFITALFVPGKQNYEVLENICPIKIHDLGSTLAMYEGLNYGNIIIQNEWS
jgi:lipopolysaccharide transport system ATP-binding protein